MRVLSLIGICLLVSSCGFEYLTDIRNDDVNAPGAAECGSCHVEQYSEWLQTAHAKAFSNEEFKDQSDNYQDEDCLFCHVPGEVLSPKREARQYNRSEGVTCVACHLHKQAMHGPHPSGALFSPHSIEKNSKVDSQLESSRICGVCHEGTYAQWEQQRKSNTYPTCHGCHGATVQRPHTKGTNFFSKLLVAFEPEHTVRSHYLMIPDQPGSAIGPELSIDKIENDTVYFTLLNGLPHDLPTGDFAEKELFLLANWWLADGVVTEKKKEKIPSILSPGEQTQITVILPDRGKSNELRVDLLRHDNSTEEINRIRSYSFSLPSSYLKN